MRFNQRKLGRYFYYGIIITIISVLGVSIGQILDDPEITAISAILLLTGLITTIGSYAREQEHNKYYYTPRPSKSKAHIYSTIITIVSLVIYFVLEEVLDFDNPINYWISGLFGVIGITMIFLTVTILIFKYKENTGRF